MKRTRHDAFSRGAWMLGLALAMASCARGADTPQAPGSTSTSTSTATTTTTTTTIQTPTAGVRFIGRFDMSDPAGPRFAWSASAMAARFTGTGIGVRLKDAGTNEFQVVVDGEPTTTVATSASRDVYTLAKGLPNGPHEIALIKRTEARLGEVQFLGFVPDEPQALNAPSPVSPHRIEFIGDSITAGYGDDGEDAHCPFTPATQNELHTFAAIASRNVGADHVSIAWSGMGVEEMARLYERTLPARSDSRWDFKAWTPDVVVINLGTNDFARYIPWQPTFVKSYVALLQRVRANYPSALIVNTLGPILSDGYPQGVMTLTKARAYLTAAVAQVKAKGDARVVFVEFATQDAKNGYGCAFHPSAKTHEVMATQLTGVLKSEMGW